ncbi:MAG: hypothetical protein ACM3X1_10550 [Ignavibacteriales bacterium]
MKYEKRENGRLIRMCPECNSFSDHSPNCTLKINRYRHYSGFRPLSLCEPDEEAYEQYRNTDWKAVKFAEMLATANNGIEP